MKPKHSIFFQLTLTKVSPPTARPFPVNCTSEAPKTPNPAP